MAGFRDQRVLITGASSGIGREAARLFADGGARVVGVARRAEPLDELAGELGADRFEARVADVADAESMDHLADEVMRAGAPDVIVANAGVGLDALFVEMTDDALRTVLEVNLFGVVRTIRPFLPAMVDRGRGRIVVVSSIVGKRGTPHYSGYSASKFALHGLADALRAELWGSGVTVGLVCPGSTDTDFRRSAGRSGPPQHSRRLRRHSARDVARAVLRMAASTRAETIVGLESKLLAFVDLLAPRLVDRLLARALLR